MKPFLLSCLLLLLLPSSLLAQTSHWRYGLYVGLAKPFNHLVTNQPLPDQQLSITSPVNRSLQATVERSISPFLSLRVGIGITPDDYGFRSSSTIRDTTGKLLFNVGAESRSGGSLAIGSAGLTVNSRLLGRVVFTGGLDAQVRANSSPGEASQISGGSSGVSSTVQGKQIRNEAIYRFRSAQISPITLGVALRAGFDYRMSKRSFFSVEATYMKGLAYTRNATATDLRIDGVRYEGRYFSRGSAIQFQVGYKHNLLRVNPTDRLQFTPYNQPQLNPPRYLSREQREETVKSKTWLYEVKAGYWPQLIAPGLSAGYFLANRQMIGLSLDYMSFNSAYITKPIGQAVLVGPFFRTYAGRGRIVPYLEGGYQLGWVRSFAGSNTQFTGVVSVGMGLGIRVNDRVRINPSYTIQQFSLAQRATLGLPKLSLTFSPGNVLSQ